MAYVTQIEHGTANDYMMIILLTCLYHQIYNDVLSLGLVQECKSLKPTQ